MQLTGLHHVTAVTANAPENLRFYTQTLGLRLVKKTVNQDDVSAYHLFYGDEVGNAGTEVTFFDWAQASPDRAGTGTISGIGLRVTGRETLEWWRSHFAETGTAHGEIQTAHGRTILPFTDAEGQRLYLVDDSGAALAGGTPWQKSAVPAAQGIRGLAGVALTVRSLAPTASVLTDVLGMRLVDATAVDGHATARFETGPGGPGAEVIVTERADLQRGHPGAGGVHHVAFRTPNFEEQKLWQERIRAAGLGTSDLIDRFYFRSLYFREPGGVLFEIATDGPGFATDENAAHLGESLALPPFLEPHRREIEAGLKPLDTARGKAAGGE